MDKCLLGSCLENPLSCNQPKSCNQPNKPFRFKQRLGWFFKGKWANIFSSIHLF